MSFSFSHDFVSHYHTELQQILDRDGIDAFRIGGGEPMATKQLSVCFGGDTNARLQTFKHQMKLLDLRIDSTQIKYDVTNIGTIHLTNSLIGYMLSDVVILCFNDDESIETWLQDVEYAFLTLQKPVNKDKTLVISCRIDIHTFSQKFNHAKKQLNNLKQQLLKIGFSNVNVLNIGWFGLSENALNDLLKEKGKRVSVGYGGMVLIPSGINKNMPPSRLGSEIHIEKAFMLSQSQITQELYERIMGENHSHFKGALLPVHNVTWLNMVEFSNKLSGREACYINIVNKTAEWRESCSGYRLPTLQEWEYAAQAFSDYKYSGSDSAEDVGWFIENSKSTPHPVGKLKMNGFGLYDMSGNVWEFCWDSDHIHYRVLRGGAWSDYMSFFTTTAHNSCEPTYNSKDYGGRLSKSIL